MPKPERSPKQAYAMHKCGRILGKPQIIALSKIGFMLVLIFEHGNFLQIQGGDQISRSPWHSKVDVSGLPRQEGLANFMVLDLAVLVAKTPHVEWNANNKSRERERRPLGWIFFIVQYVLYGVIDHLWCIESIGWYIS